MEMLKFKPTYVREDGLTVINDSSIEFPKDFVVKVRSVVVFPPGSKGGNHKHPRVEIFYSAGDLTFVYLDESEQKHEISMAPEKENYKLFIVPSFLPHAVVNKTDKDLILMEYANEEQHDKVEIEII